MANRNRSAEKEAVWRSLISAQAGSGVSVRQFCLRREVSEASFYAWRRVILQRDAERGSAAIAKSGDAASDLRPKLIPVTVAPADAATASAAPLEIVTPHGLTLRFTAATAPQTIAALIAVLAPNCAEPVAC